MRGSEKSAVLGTVKSLFRSAWRSLDARLYDYAYALGANGPMLRAGGWRKRIWVAWTIRAVAWKHRKLLKALKDAGD
jgi:hypothetical protein